MTGGAPASTREARGRRIDIDRLFAERNPSLRRRLTPVGIALLRAVIHERRLNRTVRDAETMTPAEFSRRTLRRLGIAVRVEGVANLRAAARPVVCANHPTGGVEGLALIGVLFDYLGGCKVPANDLLRLLPPLVPVVVPVRHGALTRERAGAIAELFAGDDPVLLFPAGVTARFRGTRLREAPWRHSFVTRARVSGRQILPVAVSGRNSRLFYAIHKLRRLFGIGLNIEMMMLVRELFRRGGETLVLRFLPPRDVPARDRNTRVVDIEFARSLQREVEREASQL
jgi:putative hemolysin